MSKLREREYREKEKRKNKNRKNSEDFDNTINDNLFIEDVLEENKEILYSTQAPIINKFIAKIKKRKKR